MRVAFLTYDNLSGGAATAVTRLTRGLSASADNELDITLFLASMANKDSLVHKSIIRSYFKHPKLDSLFDHLCSSLWQYFHGTKSSPKNFFMQGVRTRTNQLSNYDIVNLFWMQNFFDLSSLSTLDQPVVLTLHDMWFLTGGCSYSFDCYNYIHGCRSCAFVTPFFKKSIIQQYESKEEILSRNSTRVVVTSNWMRENALKRGIQETKISLIKNYIPDSYHYLGNQKIARRLLGIPAWSLEKKILYFVGTIADRRKGFDVFVDSLSELPSGLRKNSLILHLGPIDTHYDEYLIDLGFSIIHLGRFTDEISQIIAYNSADFLICPSRFDNTPNVIAEAHMCGLPVITSDSSGCGEMVNDSVNGYLFPSANFHELASVLKKSFEFFHRFDRFQIASDASKLYGYKSTCAHYEKLYLSMK